MNFLKKIENTSKKSHYLKYKKKEAILTSFFYIEKLVINVESQNFLFEFCRFDLFHSDKFHSSKPQH